MTLDIAWTTKLRHIQKSAIVREWPFLIVPCLFFLLFVIWTCLDRTIPMWDAAYHLADGYSIRDLIREPIGLEKKLLAIFQISAWYPPLFTWVHSLFLLMPIPDYVADRLPALVFYAVGIFAVYRLGRLLFDDPVIASVAVGIYSMIPVVYTCTHSKGLLDAPLTSMCMLTIWFMARWHSRPTMANSLAVGVTIALTCLTKQTGILYVMPPVVLIIGHRLWLRDFKALANLACGLLLGGAIYLCWLLPNLSGIVKELTGSVGSYSYMGSGLQLWFRQMKFYLIEKGPKCLSLPLTIVFVLSLLNWRAQRRLWLPASTLIGLFFLCAFSWDAHTFRYALPSVGYVSLSSAALLVDFWRSGRVFFKAIDIAVAAFLLALYLALNFSPYPFPRPAIAEALRLDFIYYGCVCPGTFPAWPWIERPPGYEWLVSQFASEKVEGRSDLMLGANREYRTYEQLTEFLTSAQLPRPIVVTVGSDIEYFSIVYLARQRAVPVVFTWLTEPGSSKIHRSPKFDSDPGPDWFLVLKKKGSGPPVQSMTKADLSTCTKLKDLFPRSSFVKVGECEVYDGNGFPPAMSTLILYRNMYYK